MKTEKKEYTKETEKQSQLNWLPFGLSPGSSWLWVSVYVCLCVRNVQEKVREMQDCSININEQITA